MHATEVYSSMTESKHTYVYALTPDEAASIHYDYSENLSESMSEAARFMQMLTHDINKTNCDVEKTAIALKLQGMVNKIKTYWNVQYGSNIELTPFAEIRGDELFLRQRQPQPKEGTKYFALNSKMFDFKPPKQWNSLKDLLDDYKGSVYVPPKDVSYDDVEESQLLASLFPHWFPELKPKPESSDVNCSESSK
jgi:hypothetical protein